MTRMTELAVRMWLEYALEGDESAMRATGLGVNGCVAVALDLMDDRPTGWAAHAKHMADHVIDGARGVR